MSKIRINELARELEVPNKVVLDALSKAGVTEKKTHSSSIEGDEAERVRKIVRGGRTGATAEKAAKPESKPKIDLSKLTKPGDAAKAIRKVEEEPPAIQKKSATPPPAATPKATAPSAAAPKAAVPTPPAAKAPLLRRPRRRCHSLPSRKNRQPLPNG